MPSYDVSDHTIRLAAVAGLTAAFACVVAGFGAINGIATSYAISYVSSLSPFIAGLSPVIVGGMIGVGLLTSLLIMRSLMNDLISYSREFPKGLASAVAYTGTAFGVGAGLVALGVTSPAAIGTIATVMGLGVVSALLTLLERPRELKNIRSEHYSNGLSTEGI